MAELSWQELNQAGHDHFQNRRYVEAADCFLRAADVNPSSAETWCSLGFSLQALGKYAESIRVFRSAIGLDPNDGQAYFGIAMSHSLSGDIETAIPAFDEALKVQPNDEVAKRELIRLLLANGKERLEAGDRHGEHDLERANKLSHNAPETAIPFIQHLLAANLHKKALQVLDDAKVANPGNPGVATLAQQIANEPSLEHARHLHGLQARPAPKHQVPRPTRSPDEITCPCGAAKVMKWAIICPTCSKRIGDPTKRTSQFANRDDIPSKSWIELTYVIIAVLWLLGGIALVLTGSFADSGQLAVVIGVANIIVALGLLFQIWWLQYLARVLMIVNALYGGFLILAAVAFESLGTFFFGSIIICAAGFSWWVIGQLSD
ncbi:MAG: tetratricopeptide repeat protein [Armatimonadetes bacterium]|nr:tetratricopeptide repeat protein [Armatimonadota bacterium]